MQLDNELADRLNEHIGVEAESAFMYFSLASWAEHKGLTGFASWFSREAEGELGHMRQFVEYLNNRDVQALFPAIPAPQAEFKSLEEVMQLVVERERGLITAINSLVALTTSKGDHFTASFLHGFIPQQIADTAESEGILARVKLAGESGQALLLLDREVGTPEGD